MLLYFCISSWNESERTDTLTYNNNNSNNNEYDKQKVKQTKKRANNDK